MPNDRLDLRRQSLTSLEQHFGKAAAYLHGVARGLDERPVQPDRVRKSVGAETTLEQDVSGWDEAASVLLPLCSKVWSACTRGGHAGRTATLKIKYADFQQVTRSRSGGGPVATEVELAGTALDLLRPLFPPPRSIRLLGVTLSNLQGDDPSLTGQLALALP